MIDLQIVLLPVETLPTLFDTMTLNMYARSSDKLLTARAPFDGCCMMVECDVGPCI